MLWFQEHPPRYLVHCLFSLFTHCASEFCLFARALISWWRLSGSYTLRSWTERRHALTRSMHRLKADAMPVAWRSPALRFQLRSPHQASSSSATERTSPSYWVGTRRDGWNGQHQHVRAACFPFRLAWEATGLMAGLLLRVSNRTETLNQVWCRRFSFQVDDPTFQVADSITIRQYTYSVCASKEHWSRLRSNMYCCSLEGKYTWAVHLIRSDGWYRA